jgi:hypothetical protein
VNAARLRVDDSHLPHSEFADYDLGQAVAHLTLKAQAMGLACRQFSAFDLDGPARTLWLHPDWAIRTELPARLTDGSGRGLEGGVSPDRR